MNAPIRTPAVVGHAAIEERSRELDIGWLRRVREASYWELQLMKRAHLNLGCDLVFGSEDFGCWKCEALKRAAK